MVTSDQIIMILNSNNISEKGESFINFLIDNIESGEHVNTDIKKTLENY